MEFVTGHAGTDHISAADMASLYRGLLIEDDVVLATGSQLECTMIDANTAEIGTGDCMLQAHHARVDVAEQLEVRSGSNGYNRNDLIVARYSLGTGNIQSVYLAVIEGTAVAGDAEDPAYVTGDIDSGATLVEFPLWRIPITGVNVGTPERIMPTVDTLQAQITSMGDSLSCYRGTLTFTPSSTTYAVLWTQEQMQSQFPLFCASSRPVAIVNVTSVAVPSATFVVPREYGWQVFMKFFDADMNPLLPNWQGEGVDLTVSYMLFY